MITKIKIENEDDLLRWTLDKDLLKNYYPIIYNELEINNSKFKNEDEVIDFIDNKLDSTIAEYGYDSDERWKIAEELTSISVFLSDGTIQKITNKSILRFNGSSVDSATCTTDGKFVYLIIDIANGQAGSLGIWDPEINNWTFAHSDEMFIVEEIQYDLDKDEFLGKWFFSYPHSPASGEGSFRITKERKLIM